MRDIKRILTANQEQEIAAKGDFIFLKSATGAISIDIQGRGVVGLEVGDNIKLKGGFGNFRIVNNTNSTNTIEVAVGDGDEFARSIVSGSVEITKLPDEFEETKQGIVFSNGGGVASSGGSPSRIQLWNPSGSGKNFIIKNLDHYVNVYSAVMTGSLGTALANLLGSQAVKHNTAGVNSVSEIRYDTVTGGYANISLFALAANANVKNTIAEGYIIPPNSGLTIRTSAVNVALYTNFKWKEEAI